MQRNMVSPRPFNTPQADLTDNSTLSPISPGGVILPPRPPKDSFTQKPSLQAYSPASDTRSSDSRVQLDRELVKDTYDDLVRRLQRENEELRNSEQSLLKIVATKQNVELELEEVSNQLATYQRNNGEAALERLKHVIQELTEQRAQLRRQLEHSRAEITKLLGSAAEIRGRGERETLSLRNQLEELRANYSALMNDYRRERAQPIQLPDSPELKRLLEAKMNEVEALKARVRFLDGQLQARSAPCVPCVGKDEMIFQLSSQLKEITTRRSAQCTQSCCVVVSCQSGQSCCCESGCCEETRAVTGAERSVAREVSVGPSVTVVRTQPAVERVTALPVRRSQGSVQTVRSGLVQGSPSPVPRVHVSPAPPYNQSNGQVQHIVYSQTTVETVPPEYRQTIVQGQRPVYPSSGVQTQRAAYPQNGVQSPPAYPPSGVQGQRAAYPQNGVQSPPVYPQNRAQSPSVYPQNGVQSPPIYPQNGVQGQRPAYPQNGGQGPSPVYRQVATQSQNTTQKQTTMHSESPVYVQTAIHTQPQQPAYIDPNSYNHTAMRTQTYNSVEQQRQPSGYIQAASFGELMSAGAPPFTWSEPRVTEQAFSTVSEVVVEMTTSLGAGDFPEQKNVFGATEQPRGGQPAAGRGPNQQFV